MLFFWDRGNTVANQAAWRVFLAPIDPQGDSGLSTFPLGLSLLICEMGRKLPPSQGCYKD